MVAKETKAEAAPKKSKRLEAAERAAAKHQARASRMLAHEGAVNTLVGAAKVARAGVYTLAIEEAERAVVMLREALAMREQEERAAE